MLVTTVVVLEAMKMANNIEAEKSGKVTAVCVNQRGKVSWKTSSSGCRIDINIIENKNAASTKARHFISVLIVISHGCWLEKQP